MLTCFHDGSVSVRFQDGITDVVDDVSRVFTVMNTHSADQVLSNGYPVSGVKPQREPIERGQPRHDAMRQPAMPPASREAVLPPSPPRASMATNGGPRSPQPREPRRAHTLADLANSTDHEAGGWHGRQRDVYPPASPRSLATPVAPPSAMQSPDGFRESPLSIAAYVRELVRKDVGQVLGSMLTGAAARSPPAAAAYTSHYAPTDGTTDHTSPDSHHHARRVRAQRRLALGAGDEPVARVRADETVAESGRHPVSFPRSADVEPCLPAAPVAGDLAVVYTAGRWQYASVRAVHHPPQPGMSPSSTTRQRSAEAGAGLTVDVRLAGGRGMSGIAVVDPAPVECPAVGDRVLAPFKGQVWCAGRIGCVGSDGCVDVWYDDGDVDRGVPSRDLARPLVLVVEGMDDHEAYMRLSLSARSPLGARGAGGSGQRRGSGEGLSVGARVVASFASEPWFRGQLLRDNFNGTWDVLYIDTRAHGHFVEPQVPSVLLAAE